MHALHDVAAPAKLNLFLHVTGRRPDGYHLLQSIFMLVDWCDTLHFERRSDGRLSREDLTVALPEDDLVLRAARALQQASGTTQGAHIAIEKRIPSQAGMGGGSSDAASCLLALNRLWETRLPLQALEQIGLALGADVPFFLRGRNALVEGIGERITPVRLPAQRFVVLKPPAGVDTREVFLSPSLKRDSKPAIVEGSAAHRSERDNTALTNDVFQLGRNDLQAVAQVLCPQVDEALRWLGSQGLQGRMTGSGSAVFAPLAPGQSVQAAPAGWALRECGNLDVHPLVGWASSDMSSVVG